MPLGPFTKDLLTEEPLPWFQGQGHLFKDRTRDSLHPPQPNAAHPELGPPELPAVLQPNSLVTKSSGKSYLLFTKPAPHERLVCYEHKEESKRTVVSFPYKQRLMVSDNNRGV